MVYPLMTPFGEIIISLDGHEIVYEAYPLSLLYRDIKLSGRYAIIVPFNPDRKNHLISCKLNTEEKLNVDYESGENVQIVNYADVEKQGYDLSIGISAETDYIYGYRYSYFDFDGAEVRNGIGYQVLPFTKTQHYPFAIAWSETMSENEDTQANLHRLTMTSIAAEPQDLDIQLGHKQTNGDIIWNQRSKNFLYHTWLVGNHYVDTDIELIAYGEKLSLVREPRNTYDKWAIRVNNEQGDKLGYIPKELSRRLAQRMDAGHEIICFAEGISNIQGKRRLFLGIYTERIFPRTIQTDRLSIRPFKLSDRADLLEIYGNPEVCQFLLHEPWNEQQSYDEIIIKNNHDLLTTDAPLNLAVELDQKVIGEISAWFTDMKETLEIGFVFNLDYGGQEYAQEAARAVIEHLVKYYKIHRIIANLDARNQASARLCQRIGMRQEGQFIQDYWNKGEWTDSYIYAILASQI